MDRLPLHLQGGAQGDRQEAGRNAREGDRHDARGLRRDRGGPSAPDVRRRPRTGQARGRDPRRRVRPGVRRPLLQGDRGDREARAPRRRQGLARKQEDHRQLHEVPEVQEPDRPRDGDPGGGPDPDGDDVALAEPEDAHRPRRRQVPRLRDAPVPEDGHLREPEMRPCQHPGGLRVRRPPGPDQDLHGRPPGRLGRPADHLRDDPVRRRAAGSWPTSPTASSPTARWGSR